MTESVFIDTGYILALVNENDQHHAEALRLSEWFDNHRVVLNLPTAKAGGFWGRTQRGLQAPMGAWP